MLYASNIIVNIRLTMGDAVRFFQRFQYEMKTTV